MDYGYYASDSSSMFDVFAGLVGASFILFVFAIVAIVLIIANWRIFSKAGIPGWKAIIPFYNSYLMYKLTFGNGWLMFISMIPFVGWIFSLVFLYKLCTVFGHGFGFMLGLLIFSPIFYLILAFDSSEYIGPLAYYEDYEY